MILHVLMDKLDMLLQAALFRKSPGANLTLEVLSLHVNVIDVLQKNCFVAKGFGAQSAMVIPDLFMDMFDVPTKSIC